MSLEEEIKGTVKIVPDFPKPGIMFKDITPIFADQQLCNKIAEEFIRQVPKNTDVIVGIESRGFLFGFLMANKLNVPFVLVRKAGKLPSKTISYEYALEYGTSKIEMQVGSLKKGMNAVLHDDLLATGGTAEAAANLITQQGANLSAFTFLLELKFLNGNKRLINYSKNIICLAQY